LSGETLFDVIVLAYLYKCEDLKISIFEFLVEAPKAGHFTKMISGGKLMDFLSENKELAGKIITDIFSRVKFGY
jgi:hypothetical protein